MNLQGKKINFLGDSITEGHGVEDKSKMFTARIAAQTGAITRNYGIGGTRIARQKTPSPEPRWDLDFPSRVDEMDSDADIVVVFGGTNDFGHGDAPLGKPDDRTYFTFYGALNLLCESLLEKYPEAKIVFLTPLHRLSEDAIVNEFGIRNQTDLTGYVQIVKEVAGKYALPVLDLFANSGLQPKVESIRTRFVPDGLHPNDAGHALLADQIIAFLQNLC